MSDNQAITPVELGKITWPLAFKIPLLSFLFALVISLTIGLTFYWGSYQLVTDKEMQQISLESDIIKPLLRSFYRQGADDVLFLRGTPPINAILAAVKTQDDVLLNVWQRRLNAIFVELLKTKKFYRRISYLELTPTIASANVLVSAIREQSKVVGLEQQQLKQNVEVEHLSPVFTANDEQLYYSKLVVSPVNNKKAVVNSYFYVSLPVFDQQLKRVFGVIAIEIDLYAFIEHLHRDVLKDIVFYISNRGGDIIFAPTFNQENPELNHIQEQFLTLMPYLNQADSGVKLFQHKNTLTNASLAFFTSLQFAKDSNIEPLLILIENSNQEFIDAIKSMRFRAVVIAIFLAAISLVLSILAARRIIKPLSTMSTGMLNYQQRGELTGLPVKENDEIGMLARSFNNLLYNLEMKSVELQQAANHANNASLKLQAILNSIVDAVISLDVEGKILAFNNGASNMFGYNESEMLGQNIKVLMPFKYAQYQEEQLRHYLQNERNHMFGVGREFPAIRKDGEVFPTIIKLSKVVTIDGTIYTALIREITQSKIQEAERQRILLETKNTAWRLNFALSAPQIGVWDQDLLSERLSWDTRMYQLFGCQPASRLSPAQLWKKAVHPQDLDAVEQKIAQTIRTGEQVHYQHRIILANDEIRHIEGHAQVMLDEHGHKVRVVGTNRDNTEQMQIQALKQQALDMANESLRLKSAFLASMSHEIRTPMNGVIGMLKLLEQSSLSEQQQHHLALAKSSAHSLLSLINDILDFSKIEAGKLELANDSFEIVTLFDEAVEAMAFQAQEKGLELILDLTQVNHSHVVGDANRLRQILSNLLGNAIKFTERGEIVIKAKLTAQKNSMQLDCTVSDTGIGIADDKQLQLFESFTQVDATSTRRYGGTGLGLAIVKQLCELMSGDISVASKTNHGSDFSFSVQLGVSLQAKSLMPAIKLANISVLIIDSNQSLLTSLVQQFQNWQANVSVAASIEQALTNTQTITAKPFDVVFLNFQQAKKHQDKLVNLAALTLGGKASSLVLMTPLNEYDSHSLITAGIEPLVLTKPVTTTHLISLLDQLFGGVEGNEKPLTENCSLTNDKSLTVVNKPVQARHILVVEDNRVNQAVIGGLLTNMGHSFKYANHGNEAIAMLSRDANDFDLVIMDCQMPLLDGYQATKKIRAGEAGQRNQKIPVIAITANAMKGDREKCLASGMNDYMTKPIDSEELQQKLHLWLEDMPLNEDSVQANAIETADLPNKNSAMLAPVSDIWHKQAFLMRIKNNQLLAQRMIELFLCDSPEVITQLLQAVSDKNQSSMVGLSHKLKGSAQNIGAKALAEILAKIECSNVMLELPLINTYCEQLTENFTLLNQELIRYSHVNQ